MKKHPSILATLVVMVVTAFGCQKAEDFPLAQNEILPLAIGNSWTYSDSLIVETTIPSLDTVVTQVTFRVEREIYVDHIIEEGGKESLERLHGWEIASNNDEFRNFGVFVRGEKIYANSEYTYRQNGEPRFLSSYYACNGIYAQLAEEPEFLNTNTAALAPVIQYPLEAGSSLQTYPIFHSYGTCLESLLSANPNIPRLLVASFGPLSNTGTSATVSTLAGTFDCVDYGSQYWSKGIGMIASSNQTTGEYYLENAELGEGTLTWKRSLISYHIE